MLEAFDKVGRKTDERTAHTCLHAVFICIPCPQFGALRTSREFGALRTSRVKNKIVSSCLLHQMDYLVKITFTFKRILIKQVEY